MDFKWLTVPFSNKTIQVEVVQTWEVRWNSKTQTSEEYTSLYKSQPELECFTSEKEAEDFAISLRNAFALLRYSGEWCAVSCAKAKSV